MNLLVLAISLVIFRPSDAFVPSTPTNSRTNSIQPQRTFISRDLQITAAATLSSTPSSYEMSSFAKRMKNIINKEAKMKKKPRVSSKAPKNLMRIKTLEEFKKVVGDEKDKIVVVRWYAPWCKACKAIAPSFYRLASQFPNVIFVDVPVTPENANLHQGLGVPSLPYGHIYHPTGRLVEEIKISKKYFPNFVKTMKSYIDNKCNIEYDDHDEVITPSYRVDRNSQEERVTA